MRKIPTIYERETAKRGHPLTNIAKHDTIWVLMGEGYATVKFDGVNVRVYQGKLYRRQKPASGEYTDASYVPIDRNTPEAWLYEAFDREAAKPDGIKDGIYECIGPKVNGNPHHQTQHELIRVLPPAPELFVPADCLLTRSFDGFRDFFVRYPMVEGLVFHHLDGRMAKIKRKDYGMVWPVPASALRGRTA